MKRLMTAAVLVMVSAAGAAEVVVKPKLTDEVLGNPGIGWQTFGRTAKQDKSLPAWIPSTVHYARWGWGQLEPKPGQIDYEFLDSTLKQSRESGQMLAFRVMCCSTNKGRPYHPGWLKAAGGREYVADHGAEGEFLVPDLDDPKTLELHLDFIARLGKRYDGHPDLDHVDLGSVGWWGEWHMSSSKTGKMPTAENCRKIVDAYLAAFRKTPLVMLIGGGEQLKHAVANGAGWRADCLGDMGGFSKNWCHMRKGYPGWIREAKLEEAWRKGPVAWESCWDMRKWVKEGWSLRYIFNYALACHGSYLNNKSAPLPEGPEVKAEIERFLRRLGYRLVLRELAHAQSVKAGEGLEVSIRWQNTGSAPCYRPYRLALRLSGEGGQHVAMGKARVNEWMPGTMPLFTTEFMKEPADLPDGDVVGVKEMLAVPADLKAGEYTLSVGVVDEQGKPVVKLGIDGRGADGWYALSKVRVK